MTCEHSARQKPSWWLEDAQALADEFPYTFHKPSAQVISNLKPGNQAKLIFAFEPDNPEDPSGERMWVDIIELKDDEYVGALDNDPHYIKDLKYKDAVTFEACHVIDTDLDDPVPSFTDKFRKCCFVTNNILYEGQKVGYFYREEPDHGDDSGWRFTTGTETDEYMDNADNVSYVTLGAVLCQDDSFVELLEHEGAVRFAREKDGRFVKLD